MQIRFEHFAVTEMMGEPDSPPRANGTLCFTNDWERTVFGMALALAREGHFEWDEFRDELIAEIAAWEEANPVDRSGWDYYERFLAALEKAVAKSGLLDAGDMATLLADLRAA
ncbi:nitrile hydratase accessory protein [Methylobrevis pamukkalensis]|uniref:Nitrile hydratase beta subunit n=1 Tax=Methylobrevis pamukkalensis TaxID=1439726 RepID=A0A1E3GYK2_9HYPH|nr:nitrile hydratase accessory protein [Methylobrevis pamukkalensis]ODN69147.1 Nitrile hydratase beta subunit [Methylobrevis pamukkalensis]